MHITFGGALFLVGIVLVIAGIMVFKAWRSGKSISIKDFRSNFKRKDKDTVECFNNYPDKYAIEKMLPNSVCKDASTWQMGTRKLRGQIYNKSEYARLCLPDDINYPPERLARMMGCMPLRKLKALKFSRWEQLAPFAPVVALGIASLLFIIVL